jgi:LCP family protein required for cell wall assembly
MVQSPHDVRPPSANGQPACPACGEVSDTAWRYCPYCGQEAPEPRAAGAFARTAPNDADDDEIVPVIVAPGAAPNRRRRRHRHKPFYRRKRVLLPTVAMLGLVVLFTGMLYRTDSMLSTVRQISTPPPVVTDNTFEQDDTPGVRDAPITVDTGPAREALEVAYTQRDLPQPAAAGGTGGIGRLSAGVQDIAGGAAVASGLQDANRDGFTMLVMGVDARPGTAIDIGVRPDVLMLVRFEPATRSCQMLSIPRDTRVELPGYGESKINHALMVGGIPYQLLVTEDFIGAPIDHYVLVDFVAFSQMVDTLGGVTVTVPEPLTKNGAVRFEAGTHRFDGDDALAYARFRTASGGGDLDRVERQWSLLASVARAANGRDLVGDVNALLPTVEDHIRTDLTLTEMAGIARTYGTGCLSIGGESVEMMRGARVQLKDPILNQTLYYNVVAPPVVQAQVDDLVGAGTERGPIARAAGWAVNALADFGHRRLQR